MLAIGGLVFVIICVFVPYVVEGGKISVILHALPFEFMTIFGAASGAFVISNSMDIVKGAVGGLGKVLSGPKFKKSDYVDLLCLMFVLTKTAKTKGMVSLEPHIEKPHESTIFQRFPKILADHFAVVFMSDYLRMMTMSVEDPHQVEAIMDKELEKHHHEHTAIASAMQTMSDGLPALGIVAAVMGVIKTMSSINEPPEILGGMIGSALVGTFLGVLLSYGIVGPLASRMKQVFDEEAKFYQVIKDCIIAHLQKSPPQVSVEVGRKAIPSPVQPGFLEIEEAVANVPPA